MRDSFLLHLEFKFEQPEVEREREREREAVLKNDFIPILPFFGGCKFCTQEYSVSVSDWCICKVRVENCPKQ